MAGAVDIALTLVVPCYNEAQRIDMGAFRDFLSKEPSVSVIFVDDGSTDGTRELLERFASQFVSRACVHVQPANAGKGEAVRAGLLRARAAGADVVGFWDADLSTPLDAVADLLDVLRTRPEIDWVFGSRVRLLGRDIERRAVRHYVGRIFATAASLTLSMPIYDTQCGAKLFRATGELDTVLKRPFVSRWIFDVEMISRFAHERNRIGDVPAVGAIYEFPLARWADIGDSKVRGLDFLRAFMDLAKLWRIRARTPRRLLFPP
ncbi:MAG: glycosyltransferase [Gemmatimonadaceae bacterium]|nr:glycosyltransferase [Gemmatimonadaceae bacterium]